MCSHENSPRSLVAVGLSIVLALCLFTTRTARSAPKPKAPTPTRTTAPARTSTPTAQPSPTATTPPPPPGGLAVRIESPRDKARLRWNSSDVSGTLAGPEFVSVVVNGETALTGTAPSGQRIFFVDDLRLGSGRNTITASAVSAEGATATHSVRVDATAAPLPARLQAEPIAGSAPLTVSFRLRTAEGSTVTSAGIDFDGNGTFDGTIPPGGEISHTYTTPALYRPRIESASSGATFVDSVGVLVTNDAEIIATVQVVWTEFRNALRAQDLERALSQVESSARDSAELLLGEIIGRAIDPDRIYGDIAPTTVYPGMAEFEMIRTDPDGETISYPILFVRDSDGIWRIKSF